MHILYGFLRQTYRQLDKFAVEEDSCTVFLVETVSDTNIYSH